MSLQETILLAKVHHCLSISDIIAFQKAGTVRNLTASVKDFLKGFLSLLFLFLLSLLEQQFFKNSKIQEQLRQSCSN